MENIEMKLKKAQRSLQRTIEEFENGKFRECIGSSHFVKHYLEGFEALLIAELEEGDNDE